MINAFICPIEENAFKRPHHPAIILKDKVLSYHNLNEAVTATADHLCDSGFLKKDRVAILAPSSAEYIILLFALWRIKAIPCLFSPRLPKKIFDQQIFRLQCRHKLVSPSLTLPTLVPSGLGGREFKFNSPPLVGGVRGGGENKSSPKYFYRFDQDADIIFTSGTTGQPKAALHTLGNHYFSAKGANQHIPFSSNDRWLLSLPLYHVGGLAILFRVFLAGGTLVIPDSQDSLQKNLKRYKITHVSFVPTQLYRLLKARSSIWKKNFKVILLGGASIPESLIKKAVQNKLPVYLTYGLTEMSSQVATSKKFQRLGQILLYRQLRIAHNGEILVKGKTLFKGYVNGRKIQRPLEDGWFRTGDLGQLNKKGLTVLGRKDRMFISSGENIQPEEIEGYLKKRKEIEEVFVVSKSHAEFGSRPVAFVKIKKGKRFNPVQLKSHLQKYLPKFKIPDQFYKLRT